MTSDLSAIRARAEAATPGPCRSIKTDLYGGGREAFVETERGLRIQIPTLLKTGKFISRKECFATADFIAGSFADIPALLAEIERLQSLLAEKGAE